MRKTCAREGCTNICNKAEAKYCSVGCYVSTQRVYKPCERNGCSNTVGRKAKRFCSMACSTVAMHEFRIENIAKTRARYSPEQHSAVARRSRAKSVYLWRARMFREEVNRLPERMTREDLYVFAARIWQKGRWAKNRAARTQRDKQAVA